MHGLNNGQRRKPRMKTDSHGLSAPPHSVIHNVKHTVIGYLGGTGFCIVVTNVYALFGHGVRSWAMDLMFLSPLLLGAFVFFCIGHFALGAQTRPGWRGFYNLYNAGVATVTVGLLFAGILEIAGTGSELTIWFFIAGVMLIACGLAISCIRKRG
jgi:hypothetical protein